jgi:formaldehyde-activating enzyme involved in methanogenesis
MLYIHIVIKIGFKNTITLLNKGIKNLTKPYAPNFNNKPAKIIEPAVGASTCASGNQKCKGTTGIFIAKAIKKKINKNSFVIFTILSL